MREFRNANAWNADSWKEDAQSVGSKTETNPFWSQVMSSWCDWLHNRVSVLRITVTEKWLHKHVCRKYTRELWNAISFTYYHTCRRCTSERRCKKYKTPMYGALTRVLDALSVKSKTETNHFWSQMQVRSLTHVFNSGVRTYV
jgi:sarcosine oxidase delta subunit